MYCLHTVKAIMVLAPVPFLAQYETQAVLTALPTQTVAMPQSVDEMETVTGRITPKHDTDPFYLDGHVVTSLYVPLIVLLAGVT